MTPALFFLVLSIGLFCWLLITKLQVRIERDSCDMLDNENIMLSSRIKHLEHKLAKKKELLEIQDQLLNENNIKY
jgi:hypothetical protein